MTADTDRLRTGWDKLRAGTLWHTTGKCRGYADANPGEAAKLTAFVDGILAGATPTPPVLTTPTGAALVEWASMALPAVAVPPVPPVPPVPAVPGDRPASFYTGPLGTNNLLPPVGHGFLASMFGGVGYSLDQQWAQTAARQTAIGRRYSIVQSHYGGDSTWGGVYGAPDPTAEGTSREARTILNGSEIMVAWTPDYTIGDMNAGAADTIWRKMATHWAGFTPHRIIVRAFHEFDLPARYGIDGPGGPYTPAQFRQAWARMVNTIRTVAPNVGFMWCPTEGAIDRSKLATYYPGDSLVDWVGTDWYNTAAWATPLHDGWAEWWELFNYAASPMAVVWSQYDIYGSGKAVSGQKGLVLPLGLPTRKPFLIAETSTVYSARKGDWWRNVIAAPNGIRSMTNCIGMSPFDCDVHSPGDFDWRVDSNAAVRNVVGSSDPAALAGFVAMAKDPYWAA